MHHHIKAHCIMLHNNLRQMMGYHSTFKLFWQKLDHFQKKMMIYLFSQKKLAARNARNFSLLFCNQFVDFYILSPPPPSSQL